MNGETKAREEKAGETPNRKQADEAERIEHRRCPRNRTFVESGRPVKNFDGGRNRNKVAQKREGNGGIGRFAGDEHVMRPNDESDDSDTDAGRGNEAIAKNRLSPKSRKKFRNNTPRR